MNKILIIGIDSLDSVLLSKFEDELPNFKLIKEKSHDINFKSVFPPDSPTCWASIYTGLNPAKHGIIFFIDPLEKMGKSINEEIDNSSIKGKTFWDIANMHGKKVFVFYPLLCYPVWNVNGMMVGRATTKRDVQIYPPIEKRNNLIMLDDLRGLPGLNPNNFIERGKALIHRETEFALNYIKEDWDLFFMYSSALDSIQHNFWNYFDNTDPTYVKGNKYETVIKEFYKEYDAIVGKFLESVDSDVVLIIISDHGHMKRPTNIVDVNMALQAKGYLKLNDQKSIKTEIYKKRSLLVDTITKFRLATLATNILQYFPDIKHIFTSPDLIDWDNTIAYVSDLSGIKTYTYGGIVIRKDKLKKEGRKEYYEYVTNDIIEILYELRQQFTNKPLVKWAKRREDLYDGKFIDKYPDVVFEFHEDYGAGWSLGSELNSCYSHNIHPGSHRYDTPVLLFKNLDKNVMNSAELMDIAPTVLDILGIKGKFEFDGKSIIM